MRRATYVFPLVLYPLSVLPLCKEHKKAIERLLLLPFVRGDANITATEKAVLNVRFMEARDAALGESQSRFDAVFPTPRIDRGLYFSGDCEGRVTFLTITLAISRAERLRKPQEKSIFLLECRSNLWVIPRSRDLSRPRRVFYRELVEVVAKDPLNDRLVLSADEFRSFWYWTPAADYLSNSEFSLTWRLVQNRLSLNDKDLI